MNKKLRIGIVLLPWIPLPPTGFAGTERVVYNLTEGLVKKGHDVSLFTTGDSQSSAHIYSILDKALGLQGDVAKTLKSSFYPWMHVAHCFENQDKFDIIHSHAQFIGLPFAAVAKTPTIHTFHRQYLFASQDETDLLLRYRRLNFISISNAQRVMDLNFIATVYNGVDTQKFTPNNSAKKDYLFWAGRITSKKGLEEAIAIAKKVQFPLIIAGKITEQEYFDNKIKPHIDGNRIKFTGEISEDNMIELFQDALLTLAPVKWNEPFGLIPVESMACGTPVIAYSNGALLETIVNNVTGFLVNENEGIEGLVKKTKQIITLTQEQYDRMSTAARNHVVEQFSNEKMVDSYEQAYYRLLQSV